MTNQKMILVLNHLFFYLRNQNVSETAIKSDPKLNNKRIIKAMAKVSNATEELIELIREEYPDEALAAGEIWKDPIKKK